MAFNFIKRPKKEGADAPVGESPKKIGKAEKRAAKAAEKMARAEEKATAKAAKKAGKKSAEKISAKTSKKQPFRATRGPKFVLFIGDEGAILVYIKGNVVQSRQFIPDASELNLNEIKQTILTDPLAPIHVVVDSMDQTFMQQTLPPVSSLSVNKLIKRRLDRDFGVNDIKGAILLGREKTGRKDWNFMMISLEKSPQLTAWLDFVEQMPNRFRGIRLVSVESEILVKNLERAMGVPKEGTGCQWKFFVSHNKVGGFRQVILRNGRIVFTRLAQPLGDSNMEVIAGNIEQEMLSTIEYMKRLSFNPQDGLDIYIIASTGIKEAIDRNKFGVSSIHIMTPFEVAEYLNIKGATQPTDQFGDVILASAIGCTRKSILTLSTPLSRKIDTYYQLVYYQRLTAILVTFGLLVFASMTGYDIYNLQDYTEDLVHKKTVNQQNLNALQSDIEKTHLDVDKAHDLIKIYEKLLGESVTPVPLIKQIKQLIHLPVLVKSIDWQLGGADEKANAPKVSIVRATSGAPQMHVTITLQFPSVANDPKVFNALSGKILADFKNAFPPPYDVSYPLIPEKFQEKSKVEINFNEENKPNTTNDASGNPELQLVIRGEVTKETSPSSPALILSQ